MRANGGNAALIRGGEELRVYTLVGGHGVSTVVVQVPCSGGTPTVTNTSMVRAIDTSSRGFAFTVNEGGGPFAPGSGEQDSESPEIEIHYESPAKTGGLTIAGGGDLVIGASRLTGAIRVNLNAGTES